MPLRAFRACLSVCAFAALLPGCKSPDQQRAEADQEVYDLVSSRRAKLGLSGETFTIEPPKDSLRQRILSGELKSSGSLTLAQVLDIAAENSRDYQAQREALYFSALDLTLERWQFKLQKTAEVDGAVDGTGSTADSASATGTLGLNKVLGSGAEVALDLGAGLARQLTFEDGWHPVTNLGLSITQPLLRGFGERIVLEPLTQAERNLVYSVRAYERYRRSYAVNAATLYYRLLQSMNAIENQEANYKSLQALTERNVALAKSGRLSDIEVGQARQDELTSRNNLIDARASLDSQLDSLKVFLGLPISFELELDRHALDALGAAQPGEELPEDHALPFAIQNRLDHLTILDQFDDSRRKVIVAEDQLRSGLTLGVTANAVSRDGQPLNYDFQHTTWATTLSWQLPIDLLPQRNGYRSSIIGLEAAARACASSEDNIEAGLRGELRAMRTQAESYQIQLNAVSLAQRRVDSTNLKLDAGRASTRDLLEAQDALLSARNSATSALIDYTLARLAVWRDLEILRVDQDGIHADEDLVLHPEAHGAQGGHLPAGG